MEPRKRARLDVHLPRESPPWGAHGLWFPLDVKLTRITSIRSFVDAPVLLKEQRYIECLSSVLSSSCSWEQLQDHARLCSDPEAAAFLVAELRHIRAHRMVCVGNAIFWACTATGSVVSNDLVPESLRRDLTPLLVALEANAIAAGRWRAESGRCVLDVVHPSREPLVFGISQYSFKRNALCGEHIIRTPTPPASRMYHNGVSLEYQLLPSAFAVATDGAVKIISRVVGMSRSPKSTTR